MFTGIVEETGEIVAREQTEEGLRLRIGADEVATGLEHGQSISVSGACLTVERYAEREAQSASEKPSGDGPREEREARNASEEASGDEYRESWFEVFLASETVERTYLGDLEVGETVNVERAMPADGRFDGHVVQGHVDAVATVRDVESVGDDWFFEFTLPEGYDRYVVEKGSITLDGISLTVADVAHEAGTVTVAIIPTTYDLTTLSEKDVGDPVHLEVDVLAKYVERLLESRFD
ncbi:riboflavin synthase [Natrarchaeobaculum sulfurireducens]|uniref:Riboflavin synthase n=1 Tax=Natrarchaeobaculum sulfurireducens TaxID=2044521 RepID=A0A346PLP7_9EURY|nr:riboflavin synthase [Natrarchaeobaculum sulfurireducens]AXR80442.1 Riboflavin synthase eubacterial/eukaryotic [Natrarchaeobaculum sulfurireducens]